MAKPTCGFTGGHKCTGPDPITGGICSSAQVINAETHARFDPVEGKLGKIARQEVTKIEWNGIRDDVFGLLKLRHGQYPAGKIRRQYPDFDARVHLLANFPINLSEFDWDLDFSDRRAQNPDTKKKSGARKSVPSVVPDDFHDRLEKQLKRILGENEVEFERRRIDVQRGTGMVEIKPVLSSSEFYNATGKCVSFRAEFGYAPAILSAEKPGPVALRVLTRLSIPFIHLPDEKQAMAFLNETEVGPSVREIVEKYNSNLFGRHNQ